jgi:outer membrane biogenesis lipoprotein LolB
MKTLKNIVSLLALVLLAGCALTGDSGNSSSQRGVGWSGSQNVQIGNTGGTKK